MSVKTNVTVPLGRGPSTTAVLSELSLIGGGLASESLISTNSCRALLGVQFHSIACRGQSGGILLSVRASILETEPRTPKPRKGEVRCAEDGGERREPDPRPGF